MATRKKDNPQLLDLVEFYRYLETKFYRGTATDEEVETLQATSYELQTAGVSI